LKKTGNETDLALQGDGYFSMMTPFGESFKRDGSFSVNQDGFLVGKTFKKIIPLAQSTD
jgi:flagellar basal-body rod protein FlgG